MPPKKNGIQTSNAPRSKPKRVHANVAKALDVQNEVFERQKIIEDNTAFYAELSEYVLGYGMLHVATPDDFGTSPILAEGLWNTRDVEPAALQRFYKHTADGTQLQTEFPPYAITVAIRKNMLDQSCKLSRSIGCNGYPTIKFNDEEPPKKKPNFILVNGRHRVHLIRKFILSKALASFEKNRAQYQEYLDSGKGNTPPATALHEALALDRETIETGGSWLALLKFIPDALEASQNSIQLRNLLAINCNTYQQEDSDQELLHTLFSTLRYAPSDQFENIVKAYRAQLPQTMTRARTLISRVSIMRTMATLYANPYYASTQPFSVNFLNKTKGIQDLILPYIKQLITTTLTYLITTFL
ncbi:hypothetical protein BD779DRAFT_1679199 [Infundibulicybe gibba]|nr:hypothetical protein BD779DRAFT_1679199 [Infundibulicybe gibba]